MDQAPANPYVARLLAGATMPELLALREEAWRAGHLSFCRATAMEIRRRSTPPTRQGVIKQPA